MAPWPVCVVLPTPTSRCRTTASPSGTSKWRAHPKGSRDEQLYGACKTDTPVRNVSTLTDEADYLLPYWLNYLGGEENYNKSMCLCAGANNWVPTHQAFNNGANNAWATVDDPQSWGYFKRQDIPYRFALAESYTVGDAYHASIASNTDPNRWFWQVSLRPSDLETGRLY